MLWEFSLRKPISVSYAFYLTQISEAEQCQSYPGVLHNLQDQPLFILLLNNGACFTMKAKHTWPAWLMYLVSILQNNYVLLPYIFLAFISSTQTTSVLIHNTSKWNTFTHIFWNSPLHNQQCRTTATSLKLQTSSLLEQARMHKNIHSLLPSKPYTSSVFSSTVVLHLKCNSEMTLNDLFSSSANNNVAWEGGSRLILS